MGSALRLFMFMRCFLLLLLISSFYLISVANSSSSSSSSYSMQQKQQQQQQQPLLCHDSESSALIQFKQSFFFGQYDHYANPKLATWKSHHGDGEGEGSSDCCSWDGVECDMETGHVIGLHLASSCLYGSIDSSSTLFNLVHLRRLDLSHNHFFGSEIPFAVGRLSRLRSLNLSDSNFCGQIPSEALSALSKLVILDLSGNPYLNLQKPGFRTLAQNLTHLKTLHLSLVDISSTVPHELANLSSLTSLFLRGCGLHGEFPANIFQLPSLQYLSVRDNSNLSGYLPEFQEAAGSPLKILHLRGTRFSGELPISIGRLGSLTELDLHSCNLTGKIPPSFANLTHLTFLSLAKNNFDVRTLSWLGDQQTKLTVLDLDQINLNGEIPSSLLNMSQLSILSLQDNQLGGQIPSWLMNFTLLTELKLARNEFVGSVPSSLFELANLEVLNLATNHLIGTVDFQYVVSKLKNLTQLRLSFNRISLLRYTNTNATVPKFNFLALDDCNLTEFPDFLPNQDELEFLFLSDNKIRGSIPQWMWNMSKATLGALTLSGNFLTGFDQLPPVLPWPKLYRFELDYNMLEGPVPIPPPSTIQYSVSGNQLTGEIPPLFCRVTSLKLLDLSGNNLSGRIPPCLAKFSESLLILNLGSNNFDGPVPETCTMPNNLMVIDLGGNQFRGRIPRSLANCTMLEHLVLGNNQIHDTFPFWLGGLPQLKVLILRSNRFHGEITGSWHNKFRFPKLRIIDLSNNEFTGDLPSKYFQNWDAIKHEVTEAKGPNNWYMQTNLPFVTLGYLLYLRYPYSMTMTNKGMQRFYEKIPDIFMAIDFSGNNFGGRIPASIGSLKGLHLLNLGGNNLTGHIPSSLGNLTQLESLDLSKNKLSGEIPWQLTSMTFLAFFNVSGNQLTGPIPQGKQFATFSNASFDGNPGLCGSPLSRACRNSSQPQPPPPPTVSTTNSTFDWKFVLLIGYGSGLVIGVSIGYCLTSWKHEWFVTTFGKRQRIKWTRTERMGPRS